MTICSDTNIVLVLFLCLLVFCNGRKHGTIKCNIKEDFNDAYVAPLVEHTSEVNGCFVAPGDQEIHVLNLIKYTTHSNEAKADYIPTITLEVKAHFGENAPKTVTLILLSASPVMWQMKIPDFENSTGFNVIVSKPSVVVSNIRVPISKRKLPPLKRLQSWISSHLGAVSSYSIIPVANDITLFLGVVSSASSEDCDFNSKRQSPHIQASFMQVQHANGCSVKHSKGDKKNQSVVYVVELYPHASTKDVSIYLDYANSTESLSVPQNVTLVLKSYASVAWTIHSTVVKGLLQIVAENSVHFRTNPSILTTVISERTLPSSTSSLLTSVFQRNGPINTYINASKVNRFNILLRVKPITNFSESSNEKYGLEDVMNLSKGKATVEKVLSNGN